MLGHGSSWQAVCQILERNRGPEAQQNKPAIGHQVFNSPEPSSQQQQYPQMMAMTLGSRPLFRALGGSR